MAGKKKATKKKAGKKKSVKKAAKPNPEGPDVDTGSHLYKLGLYAEKNGIFRKNAAKRKVFRDEFAKEQKKYPKKLDPLTEEEIAFCQGWLYVAESEFTIDYDEQVKAAIKKHLYGQGGFFYPMSG